MVQPLQTTRLCRLEDRASNRAWWICGMLFLATVLNYLDRQVLALTAERIMGEFRLNKEEFGQVLAGFRYSYAVFQLGGGWLVDVFGAKSIYPAAVVLWSLTGALTSLAASMKTLLCCRFVLGIGEALNWPCALQVTARLLRPQDRALGNGIFNSGTAVGAMIAPLIVTILTLRFGWRSSFIATGALGLFWVLVWTRLTRHSTELSEDRRTQSNMLLAYGAILRKRMFWMLAVSAIIVNSVSYFLADWIPLYLKTERGFSFAFGNALSVLIYAGMDVGNLLIGFVVRKLVALGFVIEAARRMALLISCVLMSFAVGAGLIPYRYLAVACLVLTGLGVAGFLVIYLTLVQDLDPNHVGISAGLLGGLGNLVYALLSPQIGRLADLRQTELTFILLGLLPWLSFAAILPVTRARPS